MTRRSAAATPQDEMTELLEGARLDPKLLVCVKEAGGCGQQKPVTEFYEHGNGKGGKKWRRRICRDCENSRQRKPTPARAIRNRARHRAFQRLSVMFAVDFERLYTEELEKAQHEHEVLQAIGALTVPEGEPVRLKPGPRRAGQDTTARIDTATCRRCHITHDRGHVCPNCGHTEEENHG